MTIFLIIYLLIGYPMAMWALIEDNYGTYRDTNAWIPISPGEIATDLCLGAVMTPFWPLFVVWLLMPDFVVKMYTKLVLKIISKKPDASA